MGHGIIYKATFPNGKMYIGLTIQKFNKRQIAHHATFTKRILDIANGKIKLSDIEPFYRAINKYGWDSLKWDILETEICNLNELNEREKYWIRVFKTYCGFKNSNGYNADLGGGGHERFMSLNEEELYQYGQDYKNGMTLKELEAKYKLPPLENKKYCSGERFSEYTGITHNFTVWNSNYNIFDLLAVITSFKDTGSIRETSELTGISKNAVINIVTGKSWSDLTGISDNSFYEKYKKLGPKFSLSLVQQIIELDKLGFTAKEICELVGCIVHYVRDILGGRILSEYTDIQRNTRVRRLPKSKKRNPNLSKEITLAIVYAREEEHLSAKKVGEMYGVSDTSVYKICNGLINGKYTGRKYNPETKTYDIIDVKNP